MQKERSDLVLKAEGTSVLYYQVSGSQIAVVQDGSLKRGNNYPLQPVVTTREGSLVFAPLVRAWAGASIPTLTALAYNWTPGKRSRCTKLTLAQKSLTRKLKRNDSRRVLTHLRLLRHRRRRRRQGVRPLHHGDLENSCRTSVRL